MLIVKVIKKLEDLILSIVVSVASTGILTFLYIFRRKKIINKNRNLLVIDTAYSHRSVKSFSREHFILQRKLGSYFNHVYSLYPVHGSNPVDHSDVIDGKVRFIHFARNHLFIESSISYSKFLSFLPITNFILSQIKIILVAREIVYRGNISIIRGSDPFFTGLYSYILSKLTDTPFTLRIGGNYDLLYKSGTMLLKKVYKYYFIQKIIARFIFKRCKKIAAANDSYKDYCIQNGAKIKNVFVTRFGNNMDPIHFLEPDKRCELPLKIKNILGDESLFCIYVGRIAAVKHPEDLINFMHELRNKKKDIKLLYIGEGDLLDQLITLSRKLKVEKNIIFTGKMTQFDIANTLPNACFYVSTHSGSSLAEAALSGIPIIAYDFEWQSEIVKNGITGELVEYRNWHSLAKSASKIMENKEYAKKLGVNARKLAMELMDQKKIQDHEIQHYNQLLSVIQEN